MAGMDLETYLDGEVKRKIKRSWICRTLLIFFAIFILISFLINVVICVTWGVPGLIGLMVVPCLLPCVITGVVFHADNKFKHPITLKIWPVVVK